MVTCSFEVIWNNDNNCWLVILCKQRNLIRINKESVTISKVDTSVSNKNVWLSISIILNKPREGFTFIWRREDGCLTFKRKNTKQGTVVIRGCSSKSGNDFHWREEDEGSAISREERVE